MQGHQRSYLTDKFASAGIGRWRAAALYLTVSLLGTVALTASAQAQTQSAPMENTKAVTADAPLSVWSFCERATVATEMAQRLPRAVLFSVAMVESGRFNRATKKTRPWPWTINAEGRSFYYKTKREAVDAAKQLVKDGVRSFDVGCMQINMRYHPNAFIDFEAAFDPITNVAYSAEFLKRLYARTGSWPESIAAYHSQTKTRSQPYFARVIDVWTDQHERISELAHMLREQAKAQVATQLRQTQDDVILHTAAVTPVATSTNSIAERPAPKVLDGYDGAAVRQVAVAGVGLRLSIADGDFSNAETRAARLPPRVMDEPRPTKNSAVTILADASPTL